MVFGNGETSFKKAGFPDVGTLTIYGLADEPFDVKKLGAGRSRDAYIVNEEVIVKIEVQAPPGSANTAEVISYGGGMAGAPTSMSTEPYWRTAPTLSRQMLWNLGFATGTSRTNGGM